MGVSGANEDDRRNQREQKPVRQRAGHSSLHASKQPYTSVTIASDFGASRELQKQIVDEVTQAGFNNQAAFAIKLALEEAMINAIKHGNRLDPSKSVTVCYRISPQVAEITVEDEGAGFDRGVVPDPTADENIEKCSGRGILLIEAYMSSVKYERGGRRLRLIKKNEPDAISHRP